MEKDYIYPKECFAIRGALFEVYKNIGIGFTEDIYQLALESELSARKIPFEAQKEFFVSYKGTLLNKTFRADIVCYGKIILELKSVKNFMPEHDAQLLNYLRVTNLKLGLLINFNNYPLILTKPLVNSHYVEIQQ